MPPWRALLDELHVCKIEEGEEKFPTCTLFPNEEKSYEKSKKAIMNLLSTMMSPFNYDAGKRSKAWEVKAEMQKKRLLLYVDHHFTSADSAPCSNRVLGERPWKMFLKKRSQKVKSGCVTERMELIELFRLGLEVPPPKEAMMINENVTQGR